MRENILVPLDGSKTGEAALALVKRLVADMAPEARVEVILFQVIIPAHWVRRGPQVLLLPYDESELQDMVKKAERYLGAIAGEFETHDATVTTKVTIGDAAEEIMAVAETSQATFVAMSCHGSSGLGRRTFGSVTDGVLRAGKVPVLVVRAED